MHFAHSLDNKDNTTRWHTLQDHLISTGETAAGFAREFGSQNAAKLAGILHDLGKYSLKFQARLRGAKESVDHSTAGAQVISKFVGNGFDKIVADIIAYAIAGHHAGLSDYSILQERINKVVEPIDGVWRQEIDVNVGVLWRELKHLSKSKEDAVKAAFQLAFLGRMIFSCLVDADYKDTEKFYSENERRVIDRIWPDLRTHIVPLIARFDAYMEDKSKRADVTPLNGLRQE